MFIPPGNLKQNIETDSAAGSKVQLKGSHLLIDSEVASEVFGEEQNAYVVYYPERRTLMLAPVSDELFKSLHKASQQMLKSRNLRGDKSIALHGILIDHQVNDTDRSLEYELPPGLGVLNVKL
ncbi:MAG: hypothetical protein KDD10_06265 [Phaeodactylibacter sp.]|nr:hypothetical protein [Phaeodactylibacter sp.]MCB9297422.1 hypothetical protein [Lewinellaceae bacterium]